MKSCLLSILFLLAGIIVLAQQPAPGTGLPKFHKTGPALPFTKEGFIKVNPDTSAQPQQKLLKLRAAKAVLARATFSHKTVKGDIYLLPGDRMSCLVPDMKQVKPMPGYYRPIPYNNMPNAIPPKPLRPRKNEK